MLDDFKTALKKLGAQKLNGAGELGISGLSSSEKAPSETHDREIVRHRLGRVSGQDSRTSISGRVLDHDEVLDHNGSGRRKPSTAIGRVGTRIAELPPIPSLPAVWKQKAAKAKSKRNKQQGRRSTADTPLTGGAMPMPNDQARRDSPVSPRTVAPHPYGHTSQYYGGAHDGSALPDTYHASEEEVDFITMMNTGSVSPRQRSRQISGGGSSSSSGLEKIHHTRSR